MIMLRMSSGKPGPGLPIPNKPNRNTQAKMLIIITILIPNRRRKKGIVRINSVSDIWEMESSKFECLTPNESANSGDLAKSLRKALPKAFVICRAAPSNMENIKKISIFFLLKRTKASRPREEKKEGFGPLRTGKQAGMVKA